MPCRISTLTNVPEQFAASVARFPDRLALSIRGERSAERVTYRQLDALAVSAAALLTAAGVTRGDRCAILAENSPSWVAGYLGILRLGAIAVPLDTAYSAAQVDTLLRDCGARVLLVSTRFEETARHARVTGCDLIPLAAPDVIDSPRVPPCPASPHDPAVILYTSGTTADPKGVVLTHANLLAEKDAAFQVLSVTERDSTLGVLPLFHALSQIASLLLPLAAGAHVVFLETLNTTALLRAFDEERITIFVCVPQFFYLIHKRVADTIGKSAPGRALLRALLGANAVLRRGGLNLGPIVFARAHRAMGRSIRLLVTGGSRFDEAIGRDLYAMGFNIIQAYGLTETSGGATITRPGEPIHTVGRPLPGVEIRILNDEILVRGPIVMQGYWNNREATAAVLRDGWLHTGDLGTIDEAGRLTITGRRKEVIVLSSGKNIYPEEIEAHYARSPFIGELCVIGVADRGEPSSERLHALVVPDRDVLREKKIVNVSELIRFELEGLSVLLPPHKRVLGFDVTMEPLQRTSTGKLKRYVIAQRLRPDGRTAAAPVSTSTPADEHVARVVALVQTAVRPGVVVAADSNLELDLGLDSMERVELLASLEQRFGTRVPEEVAQSAFLVRDLAEAFRGATERDDDAAGAWAAMLELSNPGEELRALLRSRPLTVFIVYAALRVLVRLLVRPRVEGLEHLPARGPYTISPNHQSYIDPLVLGGVLPFRVFRQLFFVGAAEYFQTVITAWLARRLNVVPVDPDAYLVPAMQAGAFGLRHGKVLGLFPEGERSIDGRVKKFKKGAAVLSQHLGVPVVPVAINGVFELWPRNRPLDWRRLLPWSGHRVSIRLGTPIAPTHGRSYADQIADVRSEVERMWEDADAGLPLARSSTRRKSSERIGFDR